MELLPGCRDEYELAAALLQLHIKTARGSTVYVRPGRLAAHLVRTGMLDEARAKRVSRLLRKILDLLSSEGLVSIARKSVRGTIYSVERESPLWTFLERTDVTTCAAILRALVHDPDTATTLIRQCCRDSTHT